MQDVVTYNPISTDDTDLVVTTKDCEAEISATSKGKAFSTTTILKFDMKEIGSLALDALSLSQQTLGPITKEAKETTEKVVISLRPIVEPVFQKICHRVRDWARTVTSSEIDHFLFGFVLAVALLLVVTVVVLLRKKNNDYPLKQNP